MAANDDDKEVDGGGVRFGGVRLRRRRQGSHEGRKEGGVFVVIAVVQIVGVDDGNAAFLLGGGAIN